MSAVKKPGINTFLTKKRFISANAILESLQNSPRKENLKGQIAEARGVRAYAYLFAMDLWETYLL